MKLSVYNMPGYRNVSGQVWRVLMHGRPLSRVFRVDTTTGVAWVADTDADGNIRIDRKRGEVIERRILGPMRVERLDDLQSSRVNFGSGECTVPVEWQEP